jgi:hypothetical protein
LTNGYLKVITLSGMDNLGIPVPGTNAPALLGTGNITVTATTAQAAIPAYIVSHEKNAVAISGPKLAEALAVYHRAGIRRVEAAVVAAGQPLLADCTISVRVNRQRNRTYLWLYPVQPAQALLRDLYHKYRSDAPRRAKKPMPVLILSIRPK